MPDTTPTVSAYPVENIARDVAGRLVVQHLRTAPPLTDPDAGARAALTRRCSEVRRDDLANSLYGVGDTTPGQQLVEALKAAYPELLEELERHARFGPRPNPDAYEKVCAALAKQRERADRAEKLLAAVRDHVGDHASEGEVDWWSVRELLAGREPAV